MSREVQNRIPGLGWLLRLGLVSQIFIGLLLGIVISVLFPAITSYTKVLGEIFVGALKAIAPILVFVLVISSIANQKQNSLDTANFRKLVVLYMVGMILAALIALTATRLFPVNISDLLNADLAQETSVTSIGDVFGSFLVKIIENPIKSLSEANYIGLIFWAVALGMALRYARPSTHEVLSDTAEAIAKLVYVVIRLAPIGVFGLVSASIGDKGLAVLLNYVYLLALLLGTMLFFALVVNPIIVFCITKRNPYPWVLYCLRESGVPAFFTRSSAANIPVNISIAQRLGFAKEIYSVAIPLGAVISMVGAAIVITIFAAVAAYSLNIQVHFVSAVIFSILGALCAMGASGIAGGSLLLIPVACSLFGISPEIAAQCIGIGMVISILQDSTETALNSSTDLIYMGAVCMAHENISYAQLMQRANKNLANNSVN